MARKGGDLRPLMLRLPEALRRRIEREAERNGRSMNTEVIHRLEQSFAAEKFGDTGLTPDQSFGAVRTMLSMMPDSNPLKAQMLKNLEEAEKRFTDE